MPFWINLLTAAIGFIVSAASGILIIPFLRKVKAGSTILDIGPKWHKSKEGTPLMGGFLFILGTVIAVCVGLIVYSLNVGKLNEDLDMSRNILKIVASLVMALLYMLVGFTDDYIKVVKKRNLGLNEKQKIIAQVLIAAVYLCVMYFLGDKSTSVYFPIFGWVDFWYFYYPIMIVAIMFMVNSVNLSDGIDGLCGSMTLVYALAFSVIALLLNRYENSIFAMALSGGCLGFLVWNLHPAKVFMGDTGSMFLGGCVVAFGFLNNAHLLIPLVGIVFVIESFSDIIQVISVKRRGKRVFKMAPIHHHFELMKWSEYKIVGVFTGVTVIGAIIGIILTFNYVK